MDENWWADVDPATTLKIALALAERDEARALLASYKDTDVAKLTTERDEAIKLAEKFDEELREVTKTVEKGYDEAFEMLQEEKKTNAELRKENGALALENDILKTQNERLLKALEIDKPFADTVSMQIAAGQALLYEEADQKLQDIKDKMVSKIDEFMRWQYKDIESHIDSLTNKIPISEASGSLESEKKKILEKAAKISKKSGKQIFDEQIGEVKLPPQSDLWPQVNDSPVGYWPWN